MITRWTEHLKEQEDKDSFIRELLSSRRVIDRIFQMIQEDENRLDRSELSQKAYDSPNWDFRQAHKNGRREYIREMLMLTNLDQQIERDQTNGTKFTRRELGQPS